MLILSLLFACAVPKCGAQNALSDEPARILAIGDSLLRWNEGACQSVPSHLALELGESIENRAINGATLGSIEPQYSDEAWDRVIVDGGANDVNRICECGDCEATLDRLASVDGQTGRMPDLVDEIRADGAEVLLLGYYHVSENAWYGFDRCTETITELDRRYALLADSREGVTFFDLDEVVSPEEDGWAYALDGVHPSPRGARELAAALAEVLRDELE